MVVDGPCSAEEVAHIKKYTSITNDNLAQLFMGISGQSAALAVDLSKKFEIKITEYFAENGILATMEAFESEAFRFGLWMFMARAPDPDCKNVDPEERDNTLVEKLTQLYEQELETSMRLSGKHELEVEVEVEAEGLHDD